ncbi:MAG: cysteine--tRNA ligase [Chloroflexi bacterium]|nr:cysteine--tRNA ligase [Chloroflexota bacterium]
MPTPYRSTPLSPPDTLTIFNTLSHRQEPIVPLTPGVIRMYTCGPTVYRSVHIGNLRSYLFADWLRRIFLHFGWRVVHVKNITDVGHMRQEQLERGEDKVIAAALAAGKTPTEIAAHYTAEWRADEAALNILPPSIAPHATDHIPEMIALIKRLLENGHAYEVNGTIYYDVTSFPSYGRLSGNRLAHLFEGVRGDPDPFKRHPADFTLWKRAESGRLLKWSSPWGEGFPGWHIECSAMSMRYLGESFDVHTGGVDNIFPHHEDEIAQSEGATDHPFVRYWVHGQHLLADGLKMAKSTGNAYTLADLRSRGFSPLAFRYLCLLTHYRSRLNFTFAALHAAQTTLQRLQDHLRDWEADPSSTSAPDARDYWNNEFWNAVCSDLNLPAAGAVMWRMIRSPDLGTRDKRELLLEWDDLLGLQLDAVQPYTLSSLPDDVRFTITARDQARQAHDYATADDLRTALHLHSYHLRDYPDRTIALSLPPPRPQRYSRATDVSDRIAEPDQYDFSVCLLVHNYRSDVERCLSSLHQHQHRWRVQYLIVENASTDDTERWVEALPDHYPAITILRTDHRFGEAEGRNLALRQALGRICLLLDTGTEAYGDCFTPISATLADPHIGATGRWGFRTHDLRHFTDATERYVDAIAGYCFAFRRADLPRAGWLDTKYRYYRNLDLHFSFQFLAQGYELVLLPELPIRMHEHRGWEELSEEERDKRSKRNFYRFLNAWHHHEELLVDHRHPSQTPS